METFFQDLRFALRMLAKSPLVTGAAILSLALGIGANTTIFTLVNAFFLRGPVGIEEPERVVNVFMTEAGQQFGAYMPFSRLNYEDLRDRAEVFTHLVDVINAGAALDAKGGDPEQTFGLMVTGNYFETLGVGAALGRVFGPADDVTPGAHPVVVLSHTFWQQRFGGEPTLVGETIRFNGQPFTVIGIAPPGFGGTNLLAGTQFWVPMQMYRTFLNATFLEWYQERRPGMTNAFGRLKPGVTVEQADAAVKTVGAALAQEYPVDNKNRSFTVVPLALSGINPNQRGIFVQAGGVLMGVVALVLLIACANVANLLLGRAAARRREIGVRLALGAARSRLVRQLLTESVVLALVAGGLGLLFATWGRTALWAMRPPFLQQSHLDLSFDPKVLGFTLAVSIITGVLFGLAPAIRATRTDIVDDVRQASDSARGSLSLWSLKNVVVMGQVALSLVALICAGLLVRSLGQATKIDLGFNPDRLGEMSFDVSTLGHDAVRGEQFYDQVLERARGVAGVQEATLVNFLPLAPGGLWRTVFVEGRAEEAENNRILVPVSTVEPGAFKTLGLRLVRGRDLSDQDRADTVPVVVVNEAMAKLFWSDEEAVGRRFHFFGEEVMREVVGVVHDTKYATIGEAPQPIVYLPRRQSFETAMTLAVRTAGDPAPLLDTVRKEIQLLAPALPIVQVQPVTETVELSLWNARMGARLLGALGLLALVLAAIGIYGVMAYSVNQRDREIGVRMALGAQPKEVVGMILGQGMRVAAVGLAAGLVLAAIATRALAGMLYGTSPIDALTFGTTLLLLALVAACANLVPAWRATGVDPVRVLRFER